MSDDSNEGSSTPAKPSREEQILHVVKATLTRVAKDTATDPGLQHPLSEATINEIRNCFVLIAARQKELAELAGRDMDQRPRFTDEPRPAADVVISIDSLKKKS